MVGISRESVASLEEKEQIKKKLSFIKKEKRKIKPS